MITVLFDIDGTLIRTGGAGLHAIGHAFEQLFGTRELPSIRLHGRTDQGILNDLFRHHSKRYDDHRDSFNQLYWQRLPETLSKFPGEVLPGVKQLVARLADLSHVQLGLLTGNAKQAAKIKLDHFGLTEYFAFGGFGDYHADRNQVAQLALDSAKNHLGSNFRDDRVWVIGDTVNDIVCARSIRARVMAVETGGSPREALEANTPDAILPNLGNTEHFLEIIEAA